MGFKGLIRYGEGREAAGKAELSLQRHASCSQNRIKCPQAALTLSTPAQKLNSTQRQVPRAWGGGSLQTSSLQTPREQNSQASHSKLLLCAPSSHPLPGQSQMPGRTPTPTRRPRGCHVHGAAGGRAAQRPGAAQSRPRVLRPPGSSVPARLCSGDYKGVHSKDKHRQLKES